jgi:hypothetical protein
MSCEQTSLRDVAATHVQVATSSTPPQIIIIIIIIKLLNSAIADVENVAVLEGH